MFTLGLKKASFVRFIKEIESIASSKSYFKVKKQVSDLPACSTALSTSLSKRPNLNDTYDYFTSSQNWPIEDAAISSL